MTPDPARWVSRPVSLKFVLGEFQLFRLSLPLATLDAHFTELCDDPSRSWPGWQGMPAGVDGGLIRSHPVAQSMPRKTIMPDCIRYVPYQYDHYFTEFTGSFEDYLVRFLSHSRKKRKQEISRFTRESGGRLDFRSYRTPAEVAEFLPAARELSTKTFQARLLRVGLPQSKEFHELVLRLAHEDKIRAYMLFCNGKPSAFLLNKIREPGIAVGLYTGYDPEMKAWSPGSIVFYKALEQMFAEPGLRMMDYTEGEGAHKHYYATGCRRCADVYFLRRTPRIHILLTLHSFLQSVSMVIVALLARLGIRARVKTFLRSVAPRHAAPTVPDRSQRFLKPKAHP